MKAFNRGCPIRIDDEDECDDCLFYDADNNLCEYDRNLNYERNVKDMEITKGNK